MLAQCFGTSSWPCRLQTSTVVFRLPPMDPGICRLSGGDSEFHAKLPAELLAFNDQEILFELRVSFVLVLLVSLRVHPDELC